MFCKKKKKLNLNNLNIINVLTKIKLLTCYAYVFRKPILTASTFFVPNRSRMKTTLIFFLLIRPMCLFLPQSGRDINGCVITYL